MLSHLHPAAVKAFQADVVTKGTAAELAYVLPERQIEIMEEMKAMDDHSPAFCRSLVLRSAPEQMNPKHTRRERTWLAEKERHKDLVGRLEQAEQQHDFYRKLYQ